MSVLTTYRAWLLRAVGEYQQKVSAAVGNCSAAATLPAMGADFDTQLDGLIHRLWEDVVSEVQQSGRRVGEGTHCDVILTDPTCFLLQGKAAKGQLHNITSAIMGELKQEVTEKADFEELMQAQGEDPWPPASDDAAQVEDEDSSMGVALEAFHLRLLGNNSVLPLSTAALDTWIEAHEDALRVLGDEEKEADMVRINAKIAKLIAEAGAPPFQEAKQAEGEPPQATVAMESELDYFADLLYKAKLAPHRDELLRVLAQWQGGDEPLSSPLDLVERLIDEGVLQPDVLQVGDYRYRYNDEYYD